MRYGRLTALAAGPAAIAVGLAGAAPAGAQAPGDGNYQGEPLSGDIDGNGVVDRATLTKTSPETCDVVVELGTGGGRYGPKTTYSYPEPRNAEFDFGYCPDMGVIVDLGGDGVSELVLAWFDGSPDPENVGDLLVLENFAPVAGFQAIYQPSEIGLADFNGDGLADVYEWTDQGDGFQSWLNTPGGELVAGPVRACSSGSSPDFEIADFDRDGKDDLLVAAYGDTCTQPGEFLDHAFVVFDDGSATELWPSWASRVELTDWGNNGIPDVIVTDGDTGVTHLFANDGHGHFAAK